MPPWCPPQWSVVSEQWSVPVGLEPAAYSNAINKRFAVRELLETQTIDPVFAKKLVTVH
jgi:hypothetical protein